MRALYKFDFIDKTAFVKYTRESCWVLRGLVCLGGLLFVWNAGLFAQRMVPDAPVPNFKIPVFGDDGYKIWDLRGKEGRYVNDQQIVVEGMELRVFSGDEAMHLEVTMESPQATIFIQDQRAVGNDLLFIRGPNFHIVGKGWLWNGKEKLIRIEDDVQVTFKESLGNAF